MIITSPRRYSYINLTSSTDIQLINLRGCPGNSQQLWGSNNEHTISRCKWAKWAETLLPNFCCVIQVICMQLKVVPLMIFTHLHGHSEGCSGCSLERQWKACTITAPHPLSSAHKVSECTTPHHTMDTTLSPAVTGEIIHSIVWCQNDTPPNIHESRHQSVHGTES